MNKKIIGILICMLMLSTIPLAAGMTADLEQQRSPNNKKTFVSGVIIGTRISGGGNWVTFFALNVRYRVIGTGDHGIYRLQLVRFPNDFTGFLTTPFIFGVFDGTRV